jgi:hypothetical protein
MDFLPYDHDHDGPYQAHYEYDLTVTNNDNNISFEGLDNPVSQLV